METMYSHIIAIFDTIYTPRYVRTLHPTYDERYHPVRCVDCQSAPLNPPIQLEIACSDIRQYQLHLIGRIIENVLGRIFG
jgi:hypothetical protein